MDEVFIILEGEVKMLVDRKEAILKKGDSVVVPMNKVHQMTNVTDKDIYYLVIGIALGKNGQTINVLEEF